MTKKIILDKNILIGASLDAELEEGHSIRDGFYEESSELIDTIEEREDVEGWVFEEEIKHLRNLLSTIIMGKPEHRYDCEGAHRQCYEHLEENLESLNVVSVKEDEYGEFLEPVDELYEGLKEKFDDVLLNMYGDESSIEKYGSEKDIIEELSEDKDMSNYRRLYRKLIKEPAEDEDRELMAKTMYLESLTDEEVYFASTDYHFSEIRYGDEEPEDYFVPEAIEEELGVVCEWPDRLCERYLAAS